MRTILTLCLAATGLAGFAPVTASAAEVPVKTLPSVVHIDETVIVVHRHHHYYHHRRYYWRHHHRYYY